MRGVREGPGRSPAVAARFRCLPRTLACCCRFAMLRAAYYNAQIAYPACPARTTALPALPLPAGGHSSSPTT